VAETYDVEIAVLIKKSSSGEAVADESYTFNTQTFTKMTNLATEFYKLIAALQKLK
jgi:hypothetical protein